LSIKIVYVDDEPGICQMFIDNFASDAIEIITFTDPNKFIIEHKNLELDLIILDYRFPSITGDEIAEMIGDDVPKILISGESTINSKQNFLQRFTKPFNFDEVEYFLNEFAMQKSQQK
jgi:DNA-binding NtrC family response regulator